jgi:Fic family protein
VRSSVARRLGLPTAGMPQAPRHVDGLVEMLLDATRGYAAPLTAQRLWGWQAALFPTGYSGLNKIIVGGWRQSAEPMQVVSGPIGRERVHYEAPPAGRIETEMDRFLVWWAAPPAGMDGLIRAGLAHLWFVTIHPFDDGNGRVARAVTDMARAQDEGSGARLYSMSRQIQDEREHYYAVLEQAQKGGGDITQWLCWFLGCFEKALARSEDQVNKALARARFWQEHAGAMLNPRQVKVVNRLLEAGPGGFEGGLTTRKYKGMTKTSRETAKRDIAGLVSKGILSRNPGGGRSASYSLVWP